MELNKRGVSGVIVAVLMILLVIAAVAIFWAAIRPFIAENIGAVDNTAECLTVDLEVVSATVLSEDPDSDLTMQVKKNAGDVALTGVNVYVRGQIVDTLENAEIPGLLETKTVPAGLTATVGDKVSVAGVLNEKICGTSSEEVTVTLAA